MQAKGNISKDISKKATLQSMMIIEYSYAALRLSSMIQGEGNDVSPSRLPLMLFLTTRHLG